MINIKEIELLISAAKAIEALPLLDAAIEENPSDAKLYFLRGKANWQLGRRGLAMTDYEHAAGLDPSSPAVQALQMSHDIMDFFNPDMFNP